MARNMLKPSEKPSTTRRTLCQLKRFEEAKSVLREMTPVARRVLGECHENTLMMRRNYAQALFADDDATLDDLREAVTMLEDTERIATARAWRRASDRRAKIG